MILRHYIGREWIIRNQFGRRNLITAQRTDLALKLDEVIKKMAKDSYDKNVGRPEKSNPISDTIKINTNKELAKIAGVGHNTIHRYRDTRRKAQN